MSQEQDQGQDGPTLEQRIESYKKIHLRKLSPDATKEQILDGVKSRKSRLWALLILNVVAITLFAYSFTQGITQLSTTVQYLLIGVFLVNIVMFFVQHKQVNAIKDYYEQK